MNKYQQKLDMLYTDDYSIDMLYIADFLYTRDIKFNDFDLRQLFELQLINNINLIDFLDNFGAFMYDIYTTLHTLTLNTKIINDFAKKYNLKGAN